MMTKSKQQADWLHWLDEAQRRAGLSLTADQTGQVTHYVELLLATNQVMNLTAITDPEGIALRHLLDSWTILPHLAAEAARRPQRPLHWVDVGSGAGFPGIPCKIVRPDDRVVLRDSLAKRVRFLEEVATALALQQIRATHIRAEAAGRDPAFRAQFDLAVARAVAPLAVLAEYCLPLLAKGGLMIAMKGHLEDELDLARRAIRTLGGTLESAESFCLPGTDFTRTLVRIRKSADTPAGYPRPAVKIRRHPL